MKPSKIAEIMDIASVARKSNRTLNPMFSGEAGLGKSEIVQAWVKNKQRQNPKFGFIDLRIAFLEAPDLIGFPDTKDIDGVMRTIHCLPDFWPTEGEGLLLLEEPNRGTTGVMNCLMQLLTDRKVGPKYELPKGWLIAACVNPDGASYDANSMDIALRDRFEIFEVEYDHNDFLRHMEENDWSETIVRFIKSATWTYKSSDSIGKDGKYISPRTFSKLNNFEKSFEKEKNKGLHRIISQAELGKTVGNDYWKTCFEEAPITSADILTDKAAALKKLKQQCDPKKYQGGQIEITVESIISCYGGPSKESGGTCEADKIDEETMVEIAKIIPADQAVNLIRDCGSKYSRDQKIKTTDFLVQLFARHPELKGIMKDTLHVSKAISGKKTKDQ